MNDCTKYQVPCTKSLTIRILLLLDTSYLARPPRRVGRLGKQEAKVVANQTEPHFFAVNFLLALILNAANRVTIPTGSVGHEGLIVVE